VSWRKTNACLRDPVTVRPTSSGFINILLLFLLIFELYPIISPIPKLVRGSLGGAQNTLDYSRRGILS